MPRVASTYAVQRRSKENKTFIVTLNPECGLPAEVCAHWQRRSFSCLPPELSAFRKPTSRPVAKNGAQALIEFLKKEVSKGTGQRLFGPLSIREWLVRFIFLENNPRAERYISEGTPYSPNTIEMYKVNYNRYIKDDSFLALDINTIEVPTTRAFIARIGMKKNKYDKELSGTRSFELTVNFVRMAFRQYWEDNPEWKNPFDRIKPPKRVKGQRRDILQEDEILKLFAPGVITDPLERAVAIAMFWAGLRRSEIFGLKTEDLDWKTPKLNINHSWKMFGVTDKRVLGDPKWHKRREAPFPEDLRSAIKTLQNEYGIHEFVFCNKDGSIPEARWVQKKLPEWLKCAGIDLAGRRIVPHSARHSLASVLEASGVPLRYIQDILGHSELKTTLGYLHTPEGKINEITRKIGELAKTDNKEKILQFENTG